MLRPERQPSPTTHPRVEELEGRLVPSGTVVDLTERGSEGMINDAVFRQSDAQPTGTGVIRSFVRIQTNDATAQGYNTDARPLEFDENKAGPFTRSQPLDDVRLVSDNGVLYREFLLDINQRASEPLLSLDELRLYVGDAPDLRGYDSTTKQLATLAPLYDMDAGGDNWVKLNYRLNSGSGSGDMKLLIPANLFGSAPGKYVYLYSAFGEHHGNNAGFEEWAVKGKPRTEEPPPVAPARLSGYVYHDVNQDGKRDAGDVGIGNVEVTLTGVNDLGETVVLVARTDANGFYSFENLRPGIYTILETQPTLFEDGVDTIGTQGGSVENDRFFDIFLAEGVNGEENNFGELLFLGS